MRNRFLITTILAALMTGCASGPTNNAYIAQHSPDWAMTDTISPQRITATGEGSAPTATQAYNRGQDGARQALKVKIAQAIGGSVRRVKTSKSWGSKERVIEYKTGRPMWRWKTERSNERLLELPNGGYHAFIELSTNPSETAANELSRNRAMWRRLDQRGQDVW